LQKNSKGKKWGCFPANWMGKGFAKFSRDLIRFTKKKKGYRGEPEKNPQKKKGTVSTRRIEVSGSRSNAGGKKGRELKENWGRQKGFHLK